jgi:S1-C subfamily serine protease
MLHDYESVVMVYVEVEGTVEGPEGDDSVAWSGTGFSLYSDGNKSLLLTNKHVCAAENIAKYVVIDHVGLKHPAKFYKFSPNVDLCLLIADAPIKPVHLANSDATKATHVTVIGAPQGEFPFFTDGYVGGYHHTVMKIPGVSGGLMILNFSAQFLSAPIYPGSSGSPVFNDQSDVVGIIFAGRTGADHMNLMVPIGLIKDFIAVKAGNWIR